MRRHWKSSFVALVAALAVLIPSTGALADSAGMGQVTVPDPVNHGCYYVIGWYLNVQDVKNTNAYSYGYCTN